MKFTTFNFVSINFFWKKKTFLKWTKCPLTKYNKKGLFKNVQKYLL